MTLGNKAFKKKEVFCCLIRCPSALDMLSSLGHAEFSALQTFGSENPHEKLANDWVGKEVICASLLRKIIVLCSFDWIFW